MFFLSDKKKKCISGILLFLQNFAVLKRKKTKERVQRGLEPLAVKVVKKSTARKKPSTPESARYTARPQWR